MSQFFSSCGQSIGASASVLLINIPDRFPLGLTGLISLLSKGLSRVFSKTTVQKHQFFGTQLSLYSNSHICIYYWKNHSFDQMDLCWQSKKSLLFNILSSLVIAFFPRSKHLLISGLQSLSAVILETKKMKSASVSTFSPYICHEVIGPNPMIVLNAEF